MVLHMRSKPGVLAALLALALAWLPGCGGKDEGTNPPVAGGGTASKELAAIDPADAAGYEAWLKANGLEAPEVSLSGHRGGGSETSAWPLLPRGEVRLDGLTVWRLEVDLDNYDPEAGGVLEFRKGKNVLWRDGAPFQPGEMRIVQGGVPKPVLDAVKAGDTVTWGIAFEKAPKRSMLAEFKVVNKPSAAKQIDRIENDRQNARQPAKVKALGRGQALLNNSLFAEALLTYMDLAVGTGNDPVVQEAGYRIVECMRRLGLDEAPLYSDAMALAGARKGKGRQAAGPGGVDSTPVDGLVGVAPYVPSGGVPEAAPETPGVAPKPPPSGTPGGRQPTSEKGRRAVAQLEQHAAKADQTAAQADQAARALAATGAPAEKQIEALKAAAVAAQGTARQAEAQQALDAALAKQGQVDQAREHAEDARNDRRLIELARELAAGGGVPPAPGAPGAGGPAGLPSKLAAMTKEAHEAAARAGEAQAQAERLGREAAELEAQGREGAEGVRSQADAAARRAADEADRAGDLQRRAERAMLEMERANRPGAGAPPTREEQQRTLADWAHRLEAEAQALLAASEATLQQAAAADAAGEPGARDLHERARHEKEAAAIAKQRAQNALEALQALQQAGADAPEAGR